ncbi:transmembrane protein 119 isoform X10 [Trachypithecus francoisi]|uniref:transmembrane protein 119 isoform X10 n=1 Tax=Trachypithecus francoisi TaxID=54180 RepID=UPI00141A8BB2|nr:transmembrane protein 119 isoform X10 [Trachypithecus francoisi]
MAVGVSGLEGDKMAGAMPLQLLLLLILLGPGSSLQLWDTWADEAEKALGPLLARNRRQATEYEYLDYDFLPETEPPEILSYSTNTTPLTGPGTPESTTVEPAARHSTGLDTGGSVTELTTELANMGTLSMDSAAMEVQTTHPAATEAQTTQPVATEAQTTPLAATEAQTTPPAATEAQSAPPAATEGSATPGPGDLFGSSHVSGFLLCSSPIALLPVGQYFTRLCPSPGHRDQRRWPTGPGGTMVSAAAPSLLITLLLLLGSVPTTDTRSVPLKAAFLEDMAGSGEAEGSSASSPSFPPPWTPALSPTSMGPQPTRLGGPSPPTNFLDGIVDFFRQYVMLIAVVGSLAFLLMFIVCAAVITRQKHKASAYYPSSFPKKKYVDQSDRAGGPRAFSEVPDRAPDSRPEEALDSSRQLQADILAATQNLKSPTRAALGGGEGARMVEGRGAEEEEKGSQEGDQEVQGHGVPVKTPEAQEELCSGVPEGVLVAGEGQGELEGSLLLAQEAQGPVHPPESPCACSSVHPSV